jgi:quinol monooxygenase YgiN
MYGLHGKIQSVPGKRDELAAFLLKAVAAMRELDGCYVYAINTLPDEPDTLWIYEVWRSVDDHQASLNVEAVLEVIMAARPLIAGMSDRTEVNPLGGVGVPLTE